MNPQTLKWSIEQAGWDVRRTVEHRELVIVVVTYDSADHIEACLAPLAERRVVVIDNASTDDTVARVARSFPAVRLVRLSRNLGLSQAFNIAWRQVPGCDVLVLNPDVVADPAGVDDLVETLRQEPRAAVLAPRLTYPDGTPQHTARTFPTVASILARRTPLGRTPWGTRMISAHLQHALEDDAIPGPSDWALGAAMLIRGSALQRLDGFDERYFLYCEDVDFCARAWREGLETRYVPDISFRHDYQRESRRSWDLRSPRTRSHMRSALRLAHSFPTQYLGRPLRDVIPEQRRG